MSEQPFDTYRKASESWMQMQQTLFQNLGQPSFFTPPQGMAGGPDWARNAHKRWAELAVEILNRQRESVDALYKSLIQLAEQASRISEAKSSEDYRRATEEISGASVRERQAPSGHIQRCSDLAGKSRGDRPERVLARPRFRYFSLIAVALPAPTIRPANDEAHSTPPPSHTKERERSHDGSILRDFRKASESSVADSTGVHEAVDATVDVRRSLRRRRRRGRRRAQLPEALHRAQRGSSCSTSTGSRWTRPTPPASRSSSRPSAQRTPSRRMTTGTSWKTSGASCSRPSRARARPSSAPSRTGPRSRPKSFKMSASSQAPLLPLVEQWFDSWRSAHTLGWDCLETMWGSRAPQRLRNHLLAEVRQTVASHLRSPTFLELIRWNLTAMTLPNHLTTPFHLH